MPAKIVYIEDAFAALQNSEERGLSYYFDKFYNRLVYFSNSITGSETASEDIVSEGFLKLWNKRSTLAQESHVKHFLYFVIRNDSIHYLREKKKDRNRANCLIQLSPVSENGVLERLIETESYERFYRMYARLPQKCREVFDLFYLQNKPVKEIAKELSISVNTVKSQKQRALQLLRAYCTEEKLLVILVWLALSII